MDKDTPQNEKLSFSKLVGIVMLILSIPITLFFYFQKSYIVLLGKQISEVGAVLITILILATITTSTLCVILIIKNKKLHKYINEYGIPVKVGFINAKPNY